MKKHKFTYENSAVNINAADKFVKYIAKLKKKKNQALITTILEASLQLLRFPKE